MADPPTAAPGGPRTPRRPARVLMGVGVVLLLSMLVAQLPVPAYVLHPGPVFPLADVVTVDAAAAAGGDAAPPEPISGDFLFTTIELVDAEVVDVLTAAVDPDAQVVSRRQVLGGQSERDFIAEQEAVFDDALAVAVRSGLRAVGSDLDPASVVVDSAGVGGPSAGLLIALAVADLASVDDLAAGRLVSGTGTVAADGTVGPVGSIGDKVSAAEAAGAEVFLVSVDQLDQANAAARSAEVLGVTTVVDAVAALDGS